MAPPEDNNREVEILNSAFTEIQALWDASFAQIFIACLLEYLDLLWCDWQLLHAGKDINDGLGRHSRNRGAAKVLDGQNGDECCQAAETSRLV